MNQSPRTAVPSAVLLSFLLVFSHHAAARDDVMPAPQAAPRTPVEAQKLPGSIERAFEAASKPTYTIPAKAPKTTKKEAKTTTPAASELATTAATATSPAAAQALDGASLKLGNTELQLGGLIVAPVTTPEGMVARTTLDQLIEGQNLNCVRRAAETSGRLIVTCTRGDGNDIAAEMLRAGAALYSRTAALPESTITSYRVAEMEAQQARRGLWNRVPVAADRGPETADRKPDATAPIQEKIPTVQNSAPSADATIRSADSGSRLASSSPVSRPLSPAAQEVPMEAPSAIGTFAMAAGLIGLLLIGLAFFDFLQRRRLRFDHELGLRQQRQIVAAALAGELAAARDVCSSRLHNMATGGEARYPRLRSYVYQTHVDKIGMMGPFLARQIATIYGQMADYSGTKEDLPYRNSDVMNRNALTKSLERLCGYTDAALEGLAFVEMTGDVFIPAYAENYDDAQPRQIPEQPRGGGRKVKLPSRARAALAPPAKPLGVDGPKPEPKTPKRTAPAAASAEHTEEPTDLTQQVADYVTKATGMSPATLAAKGGIKPRSLKPGANRGANPMAARAALEALEAINKEWPTDVEDVVNEAQKAV